jgi:hypothetical protein
MIKSKHEKFIEALKKLDNDDEPSEESDSENSQGTEAPSGVNQWLDNEMESVSFQLILCEKSIARIEIFGKC